MLKNIIVVLILLLLPTLLFAKLQLPDIISNDMVLQQNSTVKIWGRALPSSMISVSTEWTESKLVAKTEADGSWSVELKTTNAGGPYQITISDQDDTIVLRNILLGEVWLCAGQSNMSMPVRGFDSQPITNSLSTIIESESYNKIRMFTANRSISSSKEFNVKGNWQSASINNTGSFSAVGYFYALELYKVLNVPVGMINISWGGSNVQAWMSHESLKMYPEIDLSKIDMKNPSPQRISTALYNGMFYPVSGFGIKGIIWYQGENNINEPALYTKLFPEMVKVWRQTINREEIPFYYVQIAPYKYDGSNNLVSAYLRESQFKCQFLIPNSFMVGTADIGEEELIHTSDKHTIGKRLSYVALAKTYGYTNLPYSGPVVRKKEISGDRVIITFDFADKGLILKNNSENVFEVAGNDNIYYPAKARIDMENTKQIEIWSEEVTAPVNVRYCFRNYFAGILFNSYGLPASPFRTDTF
jgi:sialate O-acetylesterase